MQYSGWGAFLVMIGFFAFGVVLVVFAEKIAAVNRDLLEQGGTRNKIRTAKLSTKSSMRTAGIVAILMGVFVLVFMILPRI